MGDFTNLRFHSVILGPRPNLRGGLRFFLLDTLLRWYARRLTRHPSVYPTSIDLRRDTTDGPVVYRLTVDFVPRYVRPIPRPDHEGEVT